MVSRSFVVNTPRNNDLPEPLNMYLLYLPDCILLNVKTASMAKRRDLKQQGRRVLPFHLLRQPIINYQRKIRGIKYEALTLLN